MFNTALANFMPHGYLSNAQHILWQASKISGPLTKKSTFVHKRKARELTLNFGHK
uniref:Uncharacterized protein n=1 Tax=Rhizophora mucronata TaxID=61149 RepID=A0A2P2KIP8_RHIMU